jgi:tRNA pseudouridine32 synthase/23S rRNA pseudouridine746 synthase
VLVLPDGYDPTLPHLRSLLEPEFGRLWIVHRLDRFTSGLVLLARSAAAHRSLNDQFAARQVSKIYHALVASAPQWDERALDLPLRTGAGRRRRTVVDFERGKAALTQLRVLERFKTGALMEARPATGRTHQIRAHLAAAGCPLLGDRLYGPPQGAGEAQVIERVGLHALALTFQYPNSGDLHTLTAPHAADFSAALARLRSA